MKRHIARWLSALLIAALLLTPAALAEAAPEGAEAVAGTGTDDAPAEGATIDDIATVDDPIGEFPTNDDIVDNTPTDDDPIVDIPTDEAPEEAPAEAADAPVEALPEAADAVISEVVDAVVSEACDIALDAATELPEAEPEADPEAPETAPDGQETAEAAPEAAPSCEAQAEADIAEAAPAAEASAPEDLTPVDPTPADPAPQAQADDAADAAASEATAMRMEAEGEMPIDEAHFPDAGFRAYLLQGTPLGRVDQDGNGALSEAERNAVQFIQLNSATPKAGVNDTATAIEGEDYTPYFAVQSLEGIQHFPNLTYLQCSGVGLVTLDVSRNASLQNLQCEKNNLTTLTVGNLPGLEIVNCRYNQLTALNLRGCPKVSYVTCYGNNIGSLRVSKNGRYKDTRTRYFIIANGRQKFVALKKHPEAYKAVEPLRTYGEIDCDRRTKVVRADTPFTPIPGYELITAAKDYTKATVLIGTLFQIDPGASAGYSFKSSKKKVAAVDKNGVVAATGAGNTKITFKVGRRKRTLSLTVVDPTFPTNVVLDLAVTTVKRGDIVTLTPAVPEGSDPGGFKWKSSNKRVATVKDGVVTFLRPGKVTITAIAVRGKKKDSLTFTVNS